MGQKMKKSPTPSTAKKTGAGLPKGSPKRTPSSVPPDAVERLADLGRVDPNAYHDIVSDAQGAAERRIRALIGGSGDSRASVAVDAFLADVLAKVSDEEIVTRGASLEALARVVAAINGDDSTTETGPEVPRERPADIAPDVPAGPEVIGHVNAERKRRNQAFDAACARALSLEAAYGQEATAEAHHRFVCLTCGAVTDLELDSCAGSCERFAGAPTLAAVAEISKATGDEPEAVVRSLMEIGLRVLGRADRNAYFEARRMWEVLTFGAPAEHPVASGGSR